MRGNASKNKGVLGATGPQGPQGVQGPQGEKGEKGTVPVIKFKYDKDTGMLSYTSEEGILVDTDYVDSNNLATKEFVESLLNEHVEHIIGDEIDTKYNVGDNIPSLMLYEGGYNLETGVLYENAPFEHYGIIITHSCMYESSINGTTVPLTYQFAISDDGEIVHRAAWGGELSDAHWSENIIPTKLRQLSNDIGYLTNRDLQTIYTQLNQHLMKIGTLDDKVESISLNSAKTSDIPTKLSQLENDEDFAQRDAIPTRLSHLLNDMQFLTQSALDGVENEIADIKEDHVTRADFHIVKTGVETLKSDIINYSMNATIENGVFKLKQGTK